MLTGMMLEKSSIEPTEELDRQVIREHEVAVKAASVGAPIHPQSSKWAAAARRRIKDREEAAILVIDPVEEITKCVLLNGADSWQRVILSRQAEIDQRLDELKAAQREAACSTTAGSGGTSRARQALAAVA